MKSPKLTDKQAAFCRQYIQDFNGAGAARRAGYSATTSDVQAFKLLSRPHVKAEILRLQAELAASARVTVKTLLIEAEQARTAALLAGQPGAMVSASTLKAKLCGLLIEKSEDIVARAKLDAELLAVEQNNELRTAGELLARAAESLGLPRTATPAQIVGALAERPLAPPEAFRLMHAGALSPPKSERH